MTGAEVRAAIKAEVGAQFKTGVSVRNGLDVCSGKRITNALNAAPVSKAPVHIGRAHWK